MKANPLTLEALNKKIKGLIKEGLDSHWVVAEISELTVNYSGHCYLELVQKSEKSEQLIARMRAIIWSNTYRMLQPYFETTTGQAFSDGIKVMLRVVVEFHEVYGLSLNVVDIEPTYTVGEVAVRKQKILEKLHKEGVIDMNKELELPYLLKKIAIISSKTAAGLGDFMSQLENNPNGFKYHTRLYPATMQGNDAESSIINQLDRIYEQVELFDVVVIIRGGGATADLECFNSYWLAYNITQFPIPVLTGIGHEQDDTVVDVVAHTRLKTPTAVAEFLVDYHAEAENELLMVQSEIVENVKTQLADQKLALTSSAFNLFKYYGNRVKSENLRLHRHALTFSGAIRTLATKKHQQLISSIGRLKQQNQKRIKEAYFLLQKKQQSASGTLQLELLTSKHKLEKAEQAITLNNPQNVLNMGYTITLKDGKSVKNASKLKQGNEIETIFKKGKKRSIVK